jgi:hypothetical protein
MSLTDVMSGFGLHLFAGGLVLFGVLSRDRGVHVSPRNRIT